MSTVVGYIDDGHVWMGADSAGTTEGGNQFILKTPKLRSSIFSPLTSDAMQGDCS